MQELDPLLNARKHKLVHPATNASKKFIAATNDTESKLKDKYPYLNCDFLS